MAFIHHIHHTFGLGCAMLPSPGRTTSDWFSLTAYTRAREAWVRPYPGPNAKQPLSRGSVPFETIKPR